MCIDIGVGDLKALGEIGKIGIVRNVESGVTPGSAGAGRSFVCAWQMVAVLFGRRLRHLLGPIYFQFVAITSLFAYNRAKFAISV
jgi:hypothetical protein